MGDPWVKGLTKFNDITKAWILQTALFHHLAFMRSYYLPGMSRKHLKDLSPREAYKSGIKAIEAKDPVLMHGVKNGLTWGLKQDWSESLLREKTRIGKVVDKFKAPKKIKDMITGFREAQADFLFGEFGAGLKAKTYMLEFGEQLKKYPNENPDVIAKRVALLINDDFGGLHLQRLGRSPTRQHIFKLFALAPDWTESNIRTVAKTLKNKSGDKAEIAMYRKFWGGVIVKGLGASAILNYALAGGDVERLVENYKEAWESGNLNWMKIDITPVYEMKKKLFGGGDDQKRYFNLFGHFLDPVKWMTQSPVKSLHHKGSVVYGIGHELFAGTDYAGRPFTTLEELIEDHKTVKWGQGGPVDMDQFPSYVLSQLIGTQPIFFQNFIEWQLGETDGFDALATSIGLRTSKTYEKKQKGLKTLKGLK